MEVPPAAPSRRRLRRVLARVALVLAGLLAVAVLAAGLALTHLDHPWVKARIAAQAKRAAGVELDYRVLELRGLSGVHVEGLVVLNPPEVRAAATELLRLDSLDVSWAARELPKVQQVTARGLTVNLVFDESGASSLGPPSAEAPGPEVGLSRQLAELMHGAPPLEQAQVTGASLTTLRTGEGRLHERVSVTGLTLSAQTEADGAGWRLRARLGEQLEVKRVAEQTRAAEASLRLLLALDLGAPGAALDVELEAVKQTFAPELAVKELLHAQVRARFEPEQQRLAVEVLPSRLAGVANVAGALLLPDDPAVAPLLVRGSADAQLRPLLALAPPGLVPFTLEAGALRLDASDVTLSAVPRLGPEGAVTVKASATRLQRPNLVVGDTKLDVTARPDGEGFSADATVELAALELSGATSLRVPSGRVVLRAQRLAPAPASPARVAGHVKLELQLQSLAADTGPLRAVAQELALELNVPLPQREPFTLTADLPLGSLRLTDAHGKRLLSAPARLQLKLADARPAQQTGVAHVELDVGRAHLTLDATKGEDELAYAYRLEAPELGVVTPFLSAEVAARAPWRQLSATVDSTGRVTELSSESPQVDHRTTLTMPRAEWDSLRLSEVTLALRSKGDALQHDGDLELRLGQLRAGEQELGPQHVAVTAQVDRRRLKLSASVTTRAGPKLSLSTAAAYDGARRALRVDVKGSLRDAARASPLLAAFEVPPALDVTKLQTTFSLHGTVSGLVEGLSSAGELRLAKEPLVTAGFEGNAALDVSGFRWRQEGQTVVVPALKWRAELRAEGPSRSVHSVLDVERLVLVQGERRFVATNVTQDLAASLEGALGEGALTLKQTLKAATVERRPALPVPVKDVSLSVAANRQAGGFIRLSEVRLSSPETRTELTMKGTVDLSDERRQLALRGTLKQDLAALKLPELLEGRGGVELGFRVSSPDLEVFRTRSKLRLKDVHVKLPDGAVDLEGLDGEVVINESVKLGDEGLALTREIDANPYSMLRYADQHPLLSQNSFITAKRIATPYGDITGLAGNLSIDQNVVSLSQLELGLRGGRVTGQCTLDLQGKESTLELHVRATGVQSSHGEPFDGNAALVISAKQRSIDGRAEVLRIGNQHLRDLLDVQDPQHLDPAINRVRNALSVGYPEHLRLVFDHGFASMKISFGGAARLLKVDDVRGIPVGPLVSRALSSVSLP